MTTTDLIQRDLAHLWHPCSQMKDYEAFPPLEVTGAQGSYLHLRDGAQVLDAISSWWCKSLGHSHPRLQAALKKQLNQFDHVILANTTNETIVALSEKLASLTPTLNKVMFASDGSCAVEMALKMALHGQALRGNSHRTQLMALKNGYHGETSLTMAVSDLGLYRKPYEPWLMTVDFLHPVPYVASRYDPLWENCGELWPYAEKQLNAHRDTLCALIIEPLIQGAGGFLLYSQDFLRRLSGWCKANEVFLVADEIMTGLGRTGKPLACDYAGVTPDFLCLSKNLTSGMLPMSVMMTGDAIYQLFYDDYETGKAFLHSHTHSGNALAAAVALETLHILEDENIYERVRDKEGILANFAQDVLTCTNKIHNLRVLGGMAAMDIKLNKHQANQRLGYAVYQEAVKRGVLLRPLGNTLYWLPPLNCTRKELTQLRDVTIKAISSVLK